MLHRRLWAGALACALLSGASAQAEELPSREEMWKIIQAQQKEIEQLKQRTEQTDKKVEATTTAVEQVVKEGAGGPADGWWERTHIGGYGELHYNGGDKDEVDFHRFVIEVGHTFNEWISLQTELEVEHALVKGGDDSPGEVELEQAWVNFDLTERFGLRFGEQDRHNARAGVMLIPTGILNEVHEPTTFFGVERNPVESNIIPTTWWEAGVGFAGQLGDGFSYDLLGHSGLETPIAGSNAFKIRNGRNKVAKATAKSGAVTGRVKWQGLPGVEIGVSGQFQRDVTQKALDGGVETPASLVEAHADILRDGFGLRALFARWDLYSNAASAFGRDVQQGWYVEPSYRFMTNVGEVGVFARYAQWDNEAGNSVNSTFDQVSTGINYWPHEDVVLKMDFEFNDAPDGRGPDDNRLNLGLGFQY